MQQDGACVTILKMDEGALLLPLQRWCQDYHPPNFPENSTF